MSTSNTLYAYFNCKISLDKFELWYSTMLAEPKVYLTHIDNIILSINLFTFWRLSNLTYIILYIY